MIFNMKMRHSLRLGGVDLHYPKPIQGMKEEPFLSYCDVQEIKPYAVPYRCLYSRNIGNLFMAGRDISVTHVALGTVRGYENWWYDGRSGGNGSLFV